MRNNSGAAGLAAPPETEKEEEEEEEEEEEGGRGRGRGGGGGEGERRRRNMSKVEEKQLSPLSLVKCRCRWSLIRTVVAPLHRRPALSSFSAGSFAASYHEEQ